MRWRCSRSPACARAVPRAARPQTLEHASAAGGHRRRRRQPRHVAGGDGRAAAAGFRAGGARCADRPLQGLLHVRQLTVDRQHRPRDGDRTAALPGAVHPGGGRHAGLGTLLHVRASVRALRDRRPSLSHRPPPDHERAPGHADGRKRPALHFRTQAGLSIANLPFPPGHRPRAVDGELQALADRVRCGRARQCQAGAPDRGRPPPRRQAPEAGRCSWSDRPGRSTR